MKSVHLYEVSSSLSLSLDVYIHLKSVHLFMKSVHLSLDVYIHVRLHWLCQ